MSPSQAGETAHCQLEIVPEKSVWNTAATLGSVTAAVMQGKTRKRKEENVRSSH